MSLLTSTGALRAWWAVLMVLIAAIAVAGIGIVYTNRVQHESDQRWCALLATIDQPQPGAPPPNTERGRQIQQQIHALRRELGCGGAK